MTCTEEEINHIIGKVTKNLENIINSDLNRAVMEDSINKVLNARSGMPALEHKEEHEFIKLVRDKWMRDEEIRLIAEKKQAKREADWHKLKMTSLGTFVAAATGYIITLLYKLGVHTLDLIRVWLNSGSPGV
jgi:hypothetical protein